MYIGLLTVCLGNMPLGEKAEWAAANGFKALEIGCWPKDNDRDYSSSDIDVAALRQGEADGIKARVKELGLAVTSLAYYDNNLHNDAKKRTFVNDHVKKCIDAAAMLDVPTVGTFVGRDHGRTLEENFDEFEKVFGMLAAYAARSGIKLVIENCAMPGWQVPGLPGTISFTPELWEEMFRRVPDSNFGLNFDPSHLLSQMIDYIALVPEFKDKIFHVHAKDAEISAARLKRYGVYDRQLWERGEEAAGSVDTAAWAGPWGYWRYRMPGLGQVDWGKLIAALKDNGYDGVLSIEHEDPLYEGSLPNVKEGLILGRKHLERFI